MTSTYTDTTISERTARETFEQLAAATDDFEVYARPHATRLAKLADQLANLFSLGAYDRFSLRIAALAHDLGEAAMERDYIKRAGTLSAEERQDLARHTVIGEQEAARAGADRAAQLLVRWHHESWNGTGYPDALRRQQIPLMARILRVADAYASLTEARPFRVARTIHEARAHLAEEAGLEFDPRIVRAFLALNLNDEERAQASREEINGTINSPAFIAAEDINYPPSAKLYSLANQDSLHDAPNNWLAFELSVLRRLKFRSIAVPLAGEADLCHALKGWGVRVAASDPSQSAAITAAARIQHGEAPLPAMDVETLLEDAYVPGYKLRNENLRQWFNETDAWWFDNIRIRARQLSTESAQAHALLLGMMVGDYARSFDEETRVLRQPLSKVFRRLSDRHTAPAASNNSQPCSSTQREARAFIAEQHNSDLLFLRLPRAQNLCVENSQAASAWREDWIREAGELRDRADSQNGAGHGARVESKAQYLRRVEELLQTALHIRTWAIAHTEDNFVSTAELVEIITRLRKVETVYTKDFSELTGARATIITA